MAQQKRTSARTRVGSESSGGWRFSLGTAALLVAASPVYAAVGDLDPTFGNGGRTDVPLSRNYTGMSVPMAVQPDGRILVARAHLTRTDAVEVGRFTSSGALDASFGAAGWATVPFGGTDARVAAMALQADGAIVVAGQTVEPPRVARTAVVARLRSTGALDATFANSGVGRFHGNQDQQFLSVAIAESGAVVLGGARIYGDRDRDAAIVMRLTSDGGPDPQFRSGGVYEKPLTSAVWDYGPLGPGGFYSVQALPGGETLACGSVDIGYGSEAHYARLAANGQALSAPGAAPNGAWSRITQCHRRSDGHLVFLGHAEDWGWGGWWYSYVRVRPDGAVERHVFEEIRLGSGLETRGSHPEVRIGGAVPDAGGGLLFAATALSGDLVLVHLDEAGDLDGSVLQSRGIRFYDFGRDREPLGMLDQVALAEVPAGGALIAAGASPTRLVLSRVRTTPGPGATILGTTPLRSVPTEEARTVGLTVRRSGSADGAASVRYATRDGTARAGTDYVAVSGRLSWADGDTSDKVVNVAIIDDALEESDEEFEWVLDDAQGASLGGSVVVVPITGDAPNFSCWVSQGREGENATLTLGRHGGLDAAVSLHYETIAGTATSGVDFEPRSGTANWAPGDKSARVIQIPLLADAVADPGEQFWVRCYTQEKEIGTYMTEIVDVAPSSGAPPPPAGGGNPPSSGGGARSTGGGGSSGLPLLALLLGLGLLRLGLDRPPHQRRDGRAR